jgi:hypothetical protein
VVRKFGVPQLRNVDVQSQLLRPAQRVQNSLTAATTMRPTLGMIFKLSCMEMVHPMDVYRSLKQYTPSKSPKVWMAAVHHTLNWIRPHRNGDAYMASVSSAASLVRPRPEMSISRYLLVSQAI